MVIELVGLMMDREREVEQLRKIPLTFGEPSVLVATGVRGVQDVFEQKTGWPAWDSSEKWRALSVRARAPVAGGSDGETVNCGNDLRRRGKAKTR